MSVMGTVGRAAVVPANAEPGIINPRLVRYRPDHRRTGAEWLRACILAHPWQSHLRLAAQGATMEGLNMKILGDLPVVLPGRVEQAEILEAVRKGDAQSAQLSARLDDSVGRLREYRQALITAAVAGQISVA